MSSSLASSACRKFSAEEKQMDRIYRINKIESQKRMDRINKINEIKSSKVFYNN